MTKKITADGLKIVFTVGLHKTPSGISPGGAVFISDILQNHGKKWLVLRNDFEASKVLGKNLLLFESPAPDTSRIFVCTDLIDSVKDLKSGKLLFVNGDLLFNG